LNDEEFGMFNASIPAAAYPKKISRLLRRSMVCHRKSTGATKVLHIADSTQRPSGF
jgi:hypothetical protein